MSLDLDPQRVPQAGRREKRTSACSSARVARPFERRLDQLEQLTGHADIDPTGRWSTASWRLCVTKHHAAVRSAAGGATPLASPPELRVERRERLVHEQDLGLDNQRPRDCDASRIPPESLSGYASRDPASRCARGTWRARSLPARSATPATSSPNRTFSSTVFHGYDRVVLEHHRGGRVVGATVDRDVTGRRAQQPGDDPQERRLAAAKGRRSRRTRPRRHRGRRAPSSHAGAGLPEPAFDSVSRSSVPPTCPLAHGQVSPRILPRKRPVGES